MEDEPRSGRLRTVSMENVVDFIRQDRCVTVNEIAIKRAIRHNEVQEIIHSLSYRKVCGRLIQWFFLIGYL